MPGSANTEQSLLVGKKVKFSKKKDVTLIGVVLDKVDMVQKPEDHFTITGYTIQTEDGIMHTNIAHWRIQSEVI